MTETLEPDDVRVGTGMFQQGTSVATNEDRETALARSIDTRSFDAVVRLVEVDGFAVEQTADDLDPFAQGGFADRRRL